MFFSRLLTAAMPIVFASTALALDLPAYTALKTSQRGHVLEITLHNPNSQINLWSKDIQDGLTDIVSRLRSDNQTKVVVFKSDMPKFFMAHLDPFMPDLGTFATRFGTLLYNISTLPQVTIGAVEGIARGAGNELLVSLDMRFGTKGGAIFGQPEVGLGAFPGGGGSQFLPGLIGRGLAMEYILGSYDIGASEAERIGWINKAFDTPSAMYNYIDKLTSRLSLFPFVALSTAKSSINLASAPTLDQVLHDATAFNRRAGDPDALAILGRFLALTNNATLGPAEINLAQSLPLLYK